MGTSACEATMPGCRWFCFTFLLRRGMGGGEGNKKWATITCRGHRLRCVTMLRCIYPWPQPGKFAEQRGGVHNVPTRDHEGPHARVGMAQGGPGRLIKQDATRNSQRLPIAPTAYCYPPIHHRRCFRMHCHRRLLATLLPSPAFRQSPSPLPAAASDAVCLQRALACPRTAALVVTPLTKASAQAKFPRGSGCPCDETRDGWPGRRLMHGQ